MHMVDLASLTPGGGGATVPREVVVEPRDLGREVAAQIGAAEAPAQMLAAIVRAYVVALLKKPEARTAEGRSRILSALRELLDDAMLDGLRDARPPKPTRPGEAPR
jgi:hypothetical protein